MPDLRVPAKLLPFVTQKARYKVAYGGRGGGKSWAVAQTLLALSDRSKTRVLCARETQRSIRESSHRLLREQIEAMGLQERFDVQETKIVHRLNGSEISFAGIRQQGVDNLKSYEGVDICWIEEAHVVSKRSWEVLIPTIRAEGSEIWVTFNPELDTDETYKRFVIDPPADAIVVKVNYDDNPWFPEVLRREMEEQRRKDPDAAAHIWDGYCRQILDGSIFGAEIRKAQEEGRIKRIAVDPARPVHTAWDLGHADSTVIWMFQTMPDGSIHVIGHLEGSQKAIGQYIAELQAYGYVWGTDYLPHDAESHHIAAERTPAAQLRAAGRTVRVVDRVAYKHQAIEALRAVFARLWFDEGRCSDGLQALRHYRYEWNEDLRVWSQNPRHDFASHHADALMQMACGFTERRIASPRQRQQPRRSRSAANWMAA